ncbi:MAG: hypothetical protein HY547_03810 [Elusimicrobia bacterium]|nr:hypothetical protein [Elusimicrobiota bacterium]
MAHHEKENRNGGANRLGTLIQGFQKRISSSSDKDKEIPTAHILGLGSKSHRLSEEQGKLESDIQKALEELMALKNQWPSYHENLSTSSKTATSLEEKTPELDMPTSATTLAAPLGIQEPKTPSLHPPAPPPEQKNFWKKLRSMLS